MSDANLQITARGPRAEAEAAAAAIDADPQLEAAAYSILEEDEDARRLADRRLSDHGRRGAGARRAC